MDALVTAVRKLPANPTADDMHSLTRRFADADKVLKKSAATIDDTLHARLVDAAQHSYAATHFLLHRLDADQQAGTKQSQAALLAHCHELFTALAAPQLPYCLPELFVLAERYQRLAAQLGRPYAPLLSFHAALQTLHAVFPHSLTPLHCQFVKLATRAKQYRLAVSLLDSHAVYSIRERRDGVDALSYLEWCYYSALAFMVYQRWREAADHLHLALSLPGNAISKVQVAAYKKLLLVALLAGGTEVLQLGARVTSQVVMRHMEPLVMPYIELAKAFLHELNNTKTLLSAATSAAASASSSAASASASASSSSASSSASKSDTPSVAGVVANYLDDFHADHNLGLVRQLSTQLLHAQLQRLTSTYLTLPLSSLPTLLPTPSTTQPLLSHLTLLIASHRITGRVDKRADLVSFDDGDDGDDADGSADDGDQSTVAHMGALIGQLLDMRAAVAERNRRLALNALYIAKTLPADKDGGEPGGVGAGLGGIGGGDEGWGRGGGGGKRSTVRAGATTLEEEQLSRVLAASMMEQ